MADNAPPGIVWRWQPALFAALCVVPAAIVTLDDLSRGLALAFGVVPAAAVGIPPARRRRIMIVVAGVAIAVGLVVGSVLSQVPVLAVITLFVLALGAALWAGRSGVGALAMMLVVPMVAAGLGFDGVEDAIGIAALLAVGSVITWIVSLAWPDAPSMHARNPADGRMTIDPLDYGLRLGIAAALCASISFGSGFHHEGWAAAACLLVMRPDPAMVRLRGAGRAAFVTAGATAAAVLTKLDPPNAVWAVAIVLDLMLLAGTRASRWYVTGGFTTFIVISLVIHADAEHGADAFLERVLETLIGVTVALVFGSIHLRRRSVHPASTSATTP
jgi:hypothetical protein